MRFRNAKRQGTWFAFEYKTTYRMCWDVVLAYTHYLYDCFENPEILLCHDVGAKSIPEKITSLDDVLNIPECVSLTIRGKIPVSDNSVFQFIFFNQTDTVKMWTTQKYTVSIVQDEKELTEMRMFDKFMDSIELNGECFLSEKDTINRIVNTLEEIDILNSDEDVIFQNHGISVNLSKIIKSIVF